MWWYSVRSHRTGDCLRPPRLHQTAVEDNTTWCCSRRVLFLLTSCWSFSPLKLSDGVGGDWRMLTLRFSCFTLQSAWVCVCVHLSVCVCVSQCMWMRWRKICIWVHVPMFLFAGVFSASVSIHPQEYSKVSPLVSSRFLCFCLIWSHMLTEKQHMIHF